jgi:hypothetical protein
MLYDRTQAAVSEVVNELAVWIHRHWDFLLGELEDNLLLTPDKLKSYAQVVHNTGAPPMTIFAFLDCILHHICCPTFHQRVVYNGYKQKHMLKYQALKLPNGMLGHLFGPIEG